jgi:glutathione S-transferase
MIAPTTFVDLETARTARGVRLVVASGIPSPWSEAAKGIFRIKRAPFVCLRMAPRDKDVLGWTRARNVPAAMFDDEPARTGWADILELAERVAPNPPLIPAAPEDRARMFGLAHEVMGEGGLVWSGRLVTIHLGLETDGARGFPPMIAGYLAKRYGYAPERIDLARRRVAEGWALLADALGGREHYFGEQVTALDVYSAAAVNIFELMPESDCPMLPLIRTAFASMLDEVATVPRALVAHRDRMYGRYLELPIVL